jgi:competence protein ComEC
MRIIFTFLVLALVACPVYSADTLEVYVIDVEGGKALLTVAPSGESLLIDLGWPPGFGPKDRDLNRILETAKAAGLKQIDYLMISHLDIDHVGDLASFSAAIPVKHIVDSGPHEPSTRGAVGRYKTYAETSAKLDHIAVKPGDKIPLKGVDVTVVAAASKLIQSPLPGAGGANSMCSAAPAPAEIPSDVEDNMSIGLMFTFGKFRMLDLADLESAYNYRLMCPNNLLGNVDVYQVNVHAQEKGVTPVLVNGVRPRVAIVANGPRKGGDPASWPILRGAPGMEDIWQVHYSVAGGKENNPPEDYIANIDANCQGKAIRISARPDGSFTVANGRNDFQKSYKAR